MPMKYDEKLVSRVHELRTEGKSFGKIARILLQEGYTSPKGGKALAPGSISYILGNRRGGGSSRLDLIILRDPSLNEDQKLGLLKAYYLAKAE